MSGESFLSKEVVTFEKVVHLLKKTCVTNKKNLIVTKESISVILSSKEVKYATEGSNGKDLIWMSQMLKEYNMG